MGGHPILTVGRPCKAERIACVERHAVPGFQLNLMCIHTRMHACSNMRVCERARRCKLAYAREIDTSINAHTFKHLRIHTYTLTYTHQ